MRTKSGIVVQASDCPHDIITFVVIFCKQEYGSIANGAIVIDVGANIGMFTLYALSNGAEFVEAFEPCPAAFETLKTNVRINGFLDKCKLVNKAVSEHDEENLSVSEKSSPYNIAIKDPGSLDGYVTVRSIKLDTVISGYEFVSLVKIDCEGAELQILPSLSESCLQKIREIRMELHADLSELHRYLPLDTIEVIDKGEGQVWLKPYSL